MEYEIGTFTQRLIDLFVSSKQLPNMHGAYTNRFGYTQSDSTKHKKRPDPKDLKYRIQQCMNDTKTRVGDNQFTFDLGNEFMEENFPYYHILQQAPVIRKKGYGTAKSKGSQDSVKDIRQRNYEMVSFGGKMFTKEYSRNVRGQRMKLDKTSHWKDGSFENQTARQYLNVHYQYIDKICDEISEIIAAEFGMKLGRKKDTGLAEELALDWDEPVETVLDIIGQMG